MITREHRARGARREARGRTCFSLVCLQLTFHKVRWTALLALKTSDLERVRFVTGFTIIFRLIFTDVKHPGKVCGFERLHLL